ASPMTWPASRCSWRVAQVPTSRPRSSRSTGERACCARRANAARVQSAHMSEPAGDSGGQPEPQLATIGDISISQHWVVTPSGSHPIRGSVWTVTDMSRYEETISTTGLVLAIVFVWFCLLGLLFLLMKERRIGGYVQITVQGNGFH